MSPQVEKKGIQVTSTGGSVQVSAITNEPAGCSGVSIIPTAGLGYHYLAMVGNPHASSIHPTQLGILAVEDNTAVIVKLKTSSGMQFFFNHTNYKDQAGSDQLVVNLKKGEIVQLKAAFGTADVTGIKIVSKQKVSI